MGNSRANYLLKNTAIFAIGSLATKLISFFLVPLYTNVLNTSEYGTVDLVTTICTVLAPIIILNIGEGVMRFALDKDADQEKIMSIGLAVFAISIIVGLIIIPVISIFEAVAVFGVYVYFYTISMAGSQLFLCYLRGKEKLLLYSIGNILHTFGIAVLNILFLLVFGWGIKGYFLAYILANFITIIFAAVVGEVNNVFRKFKYDNKLATQMFRYSIVLIPNSFMWWIMNSSDRVMVTAMVGVAANGIYAISYKLPTLVQTFTNIFNQAWGYSAIKENDSSDRDEYSNSVFQGVIAISSISGIGLLTIMKPFLKIYVEASYYDAWKYTPYLIVGYVFLTIGTFLATSYTVNKDSKGYLISATFGAATNIVLNYILIPRIGVAGAAIATCISYIVVFVYRVFNTRKYLKLNIINTRNCLGCAGLLLTATFMFVDGWVGQILLACCLVFQILLFRTIWEPVIKKLMKRVVKRKRN